jgi:CubicO group peptidase (beta-lactamase class C family)
MHSLVAGLAAAALGVSTLAAPQDAAISLALGDSHAKTFSDAGAHTYTLEAEAGQFIYGAADQVSVDVVVTVIGPDGETIKKIDGPGRGPEVFQFETDAPGRYRIEVAPFEDERGDYSISLRRFEPLASTPEGRADQLMVAYDDANTPGGVVAVVKGGEVIFARAYGSANLAYGIPFTVDTRTNIGSTSKQFTAYAIMLLAKEGKLTLDDDVRTLLPELPDLGSTVTIRHLLTHTSGYREFLNLLAMTGRRIDRGDSIDRGELIRIIQRQTELQNEPGAEFNYNNTGYGLLATIVERIGGKPFPEWMKANVFEPLGMHDTMIRGDAITIVEHSAMGYAPGEKGGYRIGPDLGGSMGAGGIYTTVGDLARWVRNYHTGELGGSEIFEQMSTPYTLTSGKSTSYGFGLFMDEVRGLKRIHHGGADTAHRSMVRYSPDLDVAVITQSNNASFDGGITDSVAEAFFGDKMKPKASADDAETAATETFDPASFDPELFDRYAGRFEMEEVPGFILTFLREGDQYYTQATNQPRLSIVPTSPTSFKLTQVDASVTFHKGEDDAFNALTLHQNGDHPAKRLKEEPWKPTAEQLGAYAGRYYCGELETYYTVSIEDDELKLKVPRFDAAPLKATKEHSFTGAFPVATVDFKADDTGTIVALVAGNGRARGLRFERVE